MYLFKNTTLFNKLFANLGYDRIQVIVIVTEEQVHTEVAFVVTMAVTIFVMVMILTPFCLVNLSEGLKEIDAEVLEMARSFTRRRLVVLFKITLPLLMPYLISALRIAYGVGWKIALVAELFGTESGLGFLLQQAQSLADAGTVFATCLAIVLVFWLGEKAVINPLSRKFTGAASV